MSQGFALRKPKGATKSKKILGRGKGTGHGSTAGRGTKGQNARSGGGVRPGFEGGQMPLYRRIAIRGFSNEQFRKKFQIVNVEMLETFDEGSTVNKESLLQRRIVRNRRLPVKLLGTGDVNKRLVVEVDKASDSARKKIVDAGGEITIRSTTH